MEFMKENESQSILGIHSLDQIKWDSFISVTIKLEVKTKTERRKKSLYICQKLPKGAMYHEVLQYTMVTPAISTDCPCAHIFQKVQKCIIN